MNQVDISEVGHVSEEYHTNMIHSICNHKDIPLEQNLAIFGKAVNDAIILVGAAMGAEDPKKFAKGFFETIIKTYE